MPSELGSEKNKTKGNDIVLTENTDDFIIGDRVWVYGTKPGYIQYLGETRFGSGEWAGVVLDDHSGKNDGSVAGVRYFQCEPKRGVFARLHKLTRYPLSGSPTGASGGAVSPVGSNGGSLSGSSSPLPGSGLRCSTPTRAVSPGLLSSSTKPRLSDRVLVNTTNGGVKTGVLRYWGTTDFAAGEWAGVELDEPTGKNDGTVAGKKYFECPTNHGLFAPAHKVSKATGSAASRRYQQHHHGSHDSLNSSVSSKTSETAKADDRPERGSSTDLSKSPSQQRRKVLGGSTEVVEDGHKLSRTASQLEQVQRKLSQLQSEHRRYVEESEKRCNRLRQLLDTAEVERKNLNAKLEKERRRVEELQFRVDEECIGKDDLEIQTQKERSRIDELESKLAEETKKNQLLSQGTAMDSVLEELVKKHREEARTAKEDLRTANRKIQSLEDKMQLEESEEDKRRKYKARSFEEEMTRREEQLLQMQVTLDNKKRELNSLQCRIGDLEKELNKYKSRQEKHLETIDNLNVKLQKAEIQSLSVNEELHMARQKTSDAERRLASVEEKCREITKEKQSLREQMSEAVAHDQVSTALNRQIREKDRQLVELERRLAERVEAEERLRDEHMKTMRTSNSEHQEEIRSLKSKFQLLEREVARERDQFASKEEAFKLEVKRVQESQDASVKTLEKRHQEKVQLAQEAVTKLREQFSEMRIEKERLLTEKDEVQRRLELSEEHRRHSEEDREAHVAMLKSEVNRLRTEFSSHREELVKKLAENQYETRMAEDLQEQIESQRRILEEVQRRLRETQGERDHLHEELANTRMNHDHDKQDMENKSSSLKQELETLKKRCTQFTEDYGALQRSFEATQILAEQRQGQIDAHQRELQQLRTELTELSEKRMSDKERKNLENKIVDLQVELARLTKHETVSDTEYRQLQREKEALEHQVEFLQSVIVDMQKKNDDLRSRLEILETEVIFDGNLQMVNNVPYRLSCSLCGARDLHSTSDCPKYHQLLTAPAFCEESEMF